jgi:circadian clock protein KaiC
MAKSKVRPLPPTATPRLEKSPTGIAGFDEITSGGLPKGRPTLICGSAGCGKSLFSTEFLVRGAMQYDEPGVLVTFEEAAEDIKKNVGSLGFDLDDLIARKKLIIDHVQVERGQIEENGEYDLEGLFIRLAHAVDKIGAKRVVLDTIESLFAGLSNEGILRAELRRLFAWLKERQLTTVITAERGTGQLTRQGLEEYVSDCVVLLDHPVQGQISTRRLRVVKYRGSTHGTNEYPFLIDESGIAVLPVTTLGMDYAVSEERIPTGVTELDEMLDGKGFYRGSSVLVSGTAGTGKTSLGAYLANSTCERGDRCIYFSFEESPAQILRNMRSIGLKLERHVRSGLLQFHSTRPTMHGLEMHLVRMHKAIEGFAPSVVVIDPVTNLQSAGTLGESTSMLIRLIDFLRKRKITTLMTGLTGGGKPVEATDEGLSSMVDTWLLLRDIEYQGERNRTVHVLKSRGMSHSNQVREFVISSEGVRLVPVYLGASGVLTGSARLAQEARERADQHNAAEEIERRKLSLAQRRKALEAQIEALRTEIRAEEQEFNRLEANFRLSHEQRDAERRKMAVSRRAAVTPARNGAR